MTTTQKLDREQILQLAGGYRFLAVLGAAAELNLFTLLGDESLPAEPIAIRLRSNLRATTVLLDALAALGLLDKQGENYCVPADLRPWLSENAPGTALPMVLHQMSLIRMWSQLAWIVRSGEPAVRQASIRGAEADRAAFIAAMHSISGPIADDLVARLGPPKFQHLLDVGGASGTWTLAFLRAVPDARATIFDLPDAIEQARQRIAQSGLRRPRGSGGGRFLRRSAARRGRSRLGQRDRPSACPRGQPRVVRQGPRGVRARRADHDSRHRDGARSHRAAGRGPVRRQHARGHGQRRHVHHGRISAKTCRPAASAT